MLAREILVLGVTIHLHETKLVLRGGLPQLGVVVPLVFYGKSR